MKKIAEGEGESSLETEQNKSYTLQKIYTHSLSQGERQICFHGGESVMCAIPRTLVEMSQESYALTSFEKEQIMENNDCWGREMVKWEKAELGQNVKMALTDVQLTKIRELEELTRDNEIIILDTKSKMQARQIRATQMLTETEKSTGSSSSSNPPEKAGDQKMESASQIEKLLAEARERFAQIEVIEGRLKTTRK